MTCHFGPHGLSVGEMARWMYLRGFGTGHLLTMSSSVAVTEAAVRTYYSLRQLFDDAYGYRVEMERLAAGSPGPTSEPRFRALSLLAHGVATAGNAGKIAVYGANPLAINVAQWSMFARRIVQSITTVDRRASLESQFRANQDVVDAGWTSIVRAVTRGAKK